MKIFEFKSFIFFVLVQVLAISLLTGTAFASICWPSTHGSYDACISANETLRTDGQYWSAWCYGCNAGWPADQYQECVDNSLVTWQNACYDEYLKSECPDGQTNHPTAGTCIYDSDQSCKNAFGEPAFYDGNEIDGCLCDENSTYNGSVCVWNACPSEAQTRNEEGVCIDTVIDNEITDLECQSVYGLAHADSSSSTGCRCNVPDAKTELINGQIQCVYTQDYLNRQCMSQYGPSYWSENAQKCQCADLTEPDATGQCVADTMEQLEAKQELQYAFYRYIAIQGYFRGGIWETSAYRLFGIAADDYAADTGQMKMALMEKASFYSTMSVWNLSEEATIKKAVGILKGRTTKIGSFQKVIQDEGTVSVMFNDNWLLLATGKTRVDDSIGGGGKLNVMTPSSINQPKSTVYTVSYDIDSGISSTEVAEGEVEVVGPGVNDLVKNISSGNSISSNYLLSGTSDDLGTVGASCFSDTAGHSYETAICYVKDQGIVNGYEDGTYKPDKLINRAEFTKIVMESGYDESFFLGSNCFNDVHDEWFSKYVCGAYQLGIINGYSDATFKPANDINLAETLKIIFEAAAIAEGVSIPDVDGAWYQKYFDLANSVDMINTINQDPGHSLTRGEMAEIIYQAQ